MTDGDQGEDEKKDPAGSEASNRSRKPRRPPGRRALFAGTLGAVIVALAAAWFAGDSTLSGSNLLFRSAVGTGVLLPLYLAVVLLVWAWQGKTATKFMLPGGQGVEGPDGTAKDERNVEQALDQLETMRTRAETAEAMIDTLKEQLRVSNEQAKHVTKENERLGQENFRLRGGLDAMERPEEEYRVPRGSPTGRTES